MVSSPLCFLPPSQAGLSSAWNNHVDLLVTSMSCGAAVDGSKPRWFSESQKILSLVAPGCSSLVGGLLLSPHGSSLQLLVYGRIAEFVCTLINIPLKCCDVWMAWLLGNPSTQEASWVEGSLLFIVFLLLVGIDSCLPAQGQCALPSINPCGLKDLKREGDKLCRVHDVNYEHKPISPFFSPPCPLNSF